MGHIRRRGTSYDAIVEGARDLGTGRRRKHSRRFPTKAAARKGLLQLEREVRDLDPGAGPVPLVGGFLDDFITRVDVPRLRPRTILRNRGYGARLQDVLGDIRLDQLTALHIEQYKQDRLAIRAPRTVRHELAFLRRALGQAVRWGLLARNPVDAVTLPRAAIVAQRALDALEVRRLLAACDDPQLRAAVALAVASGLRQGELLALRWSRINLQTGSLRVVDALQYLHRNSISFVAPKTPQSVRTIAVGTDTITLVRHHQAYQQAAQRTLGAWDDPDLVFTDPLGAPLSPHQLVHQFHAAVRRADLGHVRWHDLRHSCASLALAAGTPVHVVAQRLGHSSATTTLAIYAHCLPHQQSEAGQTLDALVYGPPG
jgi:integrase